MNSTRCMESLSKWNIPVAASVGSQKIGCRNDFSSGLTRTDSDTSPNFSFSHYLIFSILLFSKNNLNSIEIFILHFYVVLDYGAKIIISSENDANNYLFY